MISAHEIDDHAAEYVIGTLETVERAEVARLRISHAVLDAAILAWENRLAPLNDFVTEAAPSQDLFAKIEARILKGAMGMPIRSVQKPILKTWQSFAMAASLLFVVLAGLNYKHVSTALRGSQFVAVLETKTSPPLFTVNLDRKTAMLKIHTLTALAPPDKSYELWIIPAGEKTPRAMGILPTANVDLPLASDVDLTLLLKATLAISIEPLGGSPTGAPTGPVIVTGSFKEASL